MRRCAAGTGLHCSYADTAVAEGTTYRYEVAAFDAEGNRSAAASASITTASEGPVPVGCASSVRGVEGLIHA